MNQGVLVSACEFVREQVSVAITVSFIIAAKIEANRRKGSGGKPADSVALDQGYYFHIVISMIQRRQACLVLWLLHHQREESSFF